ncbi:hypothetical protein ABPG75_013730 [Micractinium tetrahymenae]
MLPDELLAAIFGHLELKERHRAVPLVSRRWHADVHSPQLLRRLSVTVTGEPEFMRRLRLAGEWLALRAARHVRALRLRTDWPEDLIREGREPETAAIIAAALAACGAVGGLTEVELQLDGLPLELSTWLAPLARSLRRLVVDSESTLEVACSLSFLTALRELELGPLSVELAAEARLPPGLTKLRLGTLQGVADMPAQSPPRPPCAT